MFFGKLLAAGIFTRLFLDANQAQALGWPGPQTGPAGLFFVSHLCGEIALKFLLSESGLWPESL